MEWELVHQKIKGDIQAVSVFRSKLACHESLLYHARVEHLRKRRISAKEATATLFTGPASQFKFVSAVEDVVATLGQLSREYRLSQPLLVLLIVNWAAPSVVREEQMSMQLQAMTNLFAADSVDTMGIILMPIWERAKGSLYKTENLLLKSLSEKDINTDEKASLSFEDKCYFLSHVQVTVPHFCVFKAWEGQSRSQRQTSPGVSTAAGLSFA